MLTGIKVENDVYTMLASSTLRSAVSGGLYHAGTRPRDSKVEDICVGFVTGLTSQIESGVVSINIYVPDIDPYANGVWIADGQRLATLEAAAAMWVESLSASQSNYIWELQQAIMTEEEPDQHEHFIAIRLLYRYYNE